jgi:hypothetical protein
MNPKNILFLLFIIASLFDNRYVALMNAIFDVVMIGVALFLVKKFLTKN